MATNHYPQNPFALLRVSTRASRQDVVKHGKELIEDTYDEGLKNAYSKAVEEIINHPFKRLIHVVWEMPGTDYADHDETWRKLAQASRSNPITLNSLRQLADTFVEGNFYPDKLLDLLSPLLKVARPAEKHVFTFNPPVTTDLRYPLPSSELF